MGFSQAVSGLNAASNNLDVIGNNIANSATVGFKSGNVTFADMFAGSKVGMGVKVASVLQDFGNGTVTSSSRDLDIAISGGGFYRLQDTNGSTYYSRNGQFMLNGRNIVNAQGMQLTGYPVAGTPPTVQTGADPVPLTVPDGDMLASQTSVASIKANLKSSDSVPTNAWATTPGAEGTYNSKTALTTYDSQGNVHNFTLYFVKTANNTWQTYAKDDSINPATYQNAGTLNFEANGALSSTGATAHTPFTLNLTGTNGAANGTFTLNLTGSVQQNTEYSYKSPTQNGFAPGSLTGFAINDDGTIEGSYSNGQKQALGQILLASFANPEGLSPEGDNAWSETASSGQAVVGLAGTGSLGKLIGKSTESSNVDLSKELVSMIVAQRNYQSNAQTIKTQDSILQTLVSLR
ncbi:flagellar hook protein [Pectobacterium atrosepticum SCRI1043]|uniref:Flagellar hook protein FlgE n=1 Tax=Pectobacterium atrosepticum (strain SCRI 1043 / ATCC BAA-672) TaxID=218491 RepID=Q6D6H6_PECAS|nr:flagellar hook protein FlgE [Pectobacterium atrosepticum]GKV84192.1 flagellar hook protein FlgE [Pectobacterium carotovorum subsp. carotovorum]AIA70554.1 flagellar hook protein FlgE [Pectobacterium atrosepticum]AIK14680.1 flagellar hook protein [Pectobacterium atrosepticum]ATY91420.1 flagellar hook protein FlgE [Pectobacterium atrosepticum]KFX17644.1 flagellar hook protein FlgE [Pectobacterium atrosepticum]